MDRKPNVDSKKGRASTTNSSPPGIGKGATAMNVAQENVTSQGDIGQGRSAATAFNGK